MTVPPDSVNAQQRCTFVPAGEIRNWTSPLDRPITLHANDVTLRDALARIAGEAGIRLSYSEDLLPRMPRTCLAFDHVAVGDAFAELLRAAGLEPVAVGRDHVVLSPVRQPTRAGPPAEKPPLYDLEPVRVTAPRNGSAAPPAGLDVEIIEREELVAAWTGSLADALNARVPGLVLWDDPSSPVTRYASVRGASSFGASAPKVYIDGIAVANPLLLGRLTPETIERIEVIRGPQGAALYGADAISGVIHIITRRDVAAPLSAKLNSDVGMVSSDYAETPALSHEHALFVGAASATGSALLNLSLGSTGAFVPGASTDHFGADGSGRWIGERSIVTATLRFLSDRSAGGTSPLQQPSSIVSLDPPNSAIRGPARSQAVSSTGGTTGLVQYTAGVHASLAMSARWTHSLVLGVDGYSFDTDVPAAGGGATLPSGPQAAGTSGRRATARLTSAAETQLAPGLDGALTFAVDHSRMSVGGTMVPEIGPALTGRSLASSLASSSTGISGRFDVSAFDRFSLTAGLRVERAAVETGFASHALLPMLGGSWQVTDGFVETRFRAAYGKGARWPFSPLPDARSARRPALFAVPTEPEQQSGTEAGLDVVLGDRLRFELTHFDQTASNLAQAVPATVPHARERRYQSPDAFRAGRDPFFGYEVQRLGSIRNRGWELQASVGQGPFSLAGMLSFVDSRVAGVAAGYTGDLRAGDRMLGVPSLSASLTASWVTRSWAVSATTTKASDWIDYDYRALSRETETPSAEGLREYWLRYPGNTHVDLTVTRDLRPGLAFHLAIRNLLDRQTGEPDNLSILPGRTFSLGVRATF